MTICLEFEKPNFPWFNNPQCDIKEIKEGFNWRDLSLQNNTTSRSDFKDNDYLKDYVPFKWLHNKVNPNFYTNDLNVLPHPLVLETLHTIYEAATDFGIFLFCLVFDLLTNMLLYYSYIEVQKNSEKEQSYLWPLFLIAFNPISIMAVVTLSTSMNTFLLMFVVANLLKDEVQDGNVIFVAGMLVGIEPHYLILIAALVLYKYPGRILQILVPILIIA